MAAHDFIGAARSYRAALRENAACVDAHFGLAELLLLLGRWPEGWAEYEWRQHRPQCDLTQYPLPRWTGETLREGHVLIQAEQGLGDTIQFARYVPLVAERVRQVSLVVQPPLVRLMGHLESCAHLMKNGERAGGFTSWVPLLSLPGIFHTTPESIPLPLVYADKPKLAHRTAKARSLKVGLAWRTNARSGTAARKSVRLEELLPLGEVAGVSWVSLQREMTEAENDLFVKKFHGEIVPEKLADFTDTARWMTELDLVISLDSAVAHLAGSVARRTWIFLAHHADWRWLRERSDSPWYPDMRLFRCPKAEAWAEPIKNMAAALALPGAGTQA